MYDVYEAMVEASEPRETREDVVEYYQWKYGNNVASWGTPLAKDLQQYTKNKKGAPMEVRNIRRRFERRKGVDPLSKPVKSKQQIEEYKELGATLPPKPPKNGYRVTGVICVHYADDECEPRRLIRNKSEVQIKGDTAMQFAEDPHLQGIVNLYMGEAYDEEEPTLAACDGDGECETDLEIEPIEEEESVPDNVRQARERLDEMMEEYDESL